MRRTVRIKAPWELAIMRSNGRRLAEVAARIQEHAVPGASSIDLDRIAEEMIRGMGAVPSFKGYVVDAVPFPATICASPNEQVVHGIPTSDPLADGDVLSVDFGLVHSGYHADMAVTLVIGETADRVQQLVEATRAALQVGADAARVGHRIGDIGHAIESFIRPQGFEVVRQYAGHGIGRDLHERPLVPNFGKARTGDRIKVGMCLAIEPMITLGTWDTRTLDDGWTVVTVDGSLAAHFEHTIAITPTGPEILTVLDADAAIARVA